MFFEDRCFGYVVFNQGRSLKLYTETVRIWMRNVNQGIEAFYRERALSNLIAQIKADQIRDKQTGLYNYKGFHEKFEELIQNSLNKDNSVAIIAFDLDNLSGINEEFSRVGGALKIDLSEDGERIYLSVFNEGQGIADKDKPYVFDRFYKADVSRGLDRNGYGLGLYISKKIADSPFFST